MVLFDLIHSNGVQQVLNLVNKLILIIRWVVPIGLIIMTSIDIFNKIINPDDKDGQRRIMNRFIAAVIVFFLPTIINIIMKLVEIGTDGKVTNNTSQNNTGQNDNNTNNDKPKATEVPEKVQILNCPSNDKVFDKGDKIILNAKGTNINWVMFSAEQYLDIIPSSDGKSANIIVMDYYAAGYVTVIAQGNTSYEMCKINIRNREKTQGNVFINNCPNDKIRVGDIFTLTTNEDVSWFNDIYFNYYEIVSVTPRTVDIKVIGHYTDLLPVRIRVKNVNNQEGFCAFYTYN